MLTMFCRVGFFPAIRDAGSPPGTMMKTRKTRKLTAKSTATIPSSRRTRNAPTSGSPRAVAWRAVRGEPPSVFHPHLGTRVERVAQPVAEDVEREHREHDCDPGHERQPRRRHDSLL